VTCSLKAAEETSVVTLRHSKEHVGVATVIHSSTEEIWEAVVSAGPCRGYIWRIETRRKGQAYSYETNPSSSQRICYIRTTTAMVQLQNKKEEISGRESRGAWRQDELIGGKPPVVK
jgi:hypothetical protein